MRNYEEVFAAHTKTTPALFSFLAGSSEQDPTEALGILWNSRFTSNLSLITLLIEMMPPLVVSLIAPTTYKTSCSF